MNLYLDIGNSRSKYVTSRRSDLSSIQYVDSHLIEAQWLSTHFSKIKKCYIANVNQQELANTISEWCLSQGIDCAILHSENEKFGVACSYENPNFYGVDRWLTLLGANLLYPNKTCLIIDAGTATTIDLLSQHGQHIGGWILSGIDLLISSLLANTKKISAKPQLVESFKFANNSSDAVSQAAWSATIGMINNAVELAIEEHGVPAEQLKIVVTGGNGKLLSQHLKGECEVIDDLIFVGMQRYN